MSQSYHTSGPSPVCVCFPLKCLSLFFPLQTPIHPSNPSSEVAPFEALPDPPVPPSIMGIPLVAPSAAALALRPFPPLMATGPPTSWGPRLPPSSPVPLLGPVFLWGCGEDRSLCSSSPIPPGKNSCSLFSPISLKDKNQGELIPPVLRFTVTYLREKGESWLQPRHLPGGPSWSLSTPQARELGELEPVHGG